MADGFRSRFATARESPGFLLWRVTHAWQRAVRDTLAEVDLTHVQFVLLASLAWLGRAGATVTQVEVARHAGIDRMMTSQVVRGLESRGLLQRPPHPDDRRARALALTEAGRARVAEALPRVEAADAAFFAPAGGDLPRLVEVLARLAAAQPGE